MNDRERNRFEMIKRVSKFRTDNVALFPVAPTTAPDIKVASLFTTTERSTGWKASVTFLA